MSAARPPEGAHTVAEGAGTPVHAARPPEGAHTAAESAGVPVSFWKTAPGPVPEPPMLQSLAFSLAFPCGGTGSTCRQLTCRAVTPSTNHMRACSGPTSTVTTRCCGPTATADSTRAAAPEAGPPAPWRWRRTSQASQAIAPTNSSTATEGSRFEVMPPLVSRHRSDGAGCAPPSERSARRIARPIPSASVLASAATPRCASMASADRQMVGDATLATADAPQALGGRHHIGQADAELVVDHHHLALGDQIAVDQHVHRLAGQCIELHHRALRQLQYVFDRHLGAPELHRQLHRDVQHPVDVVDDLLAAVDSAGATGGAGKRGTHRLAAQGPPLLPLGGRLVAAFLLFQRLGPAIERVVRRVVCGGALASAGRAIFS